MRKKIGMTKNIIRIEHFNFALITKNHLCDERTYQIEIPKEMIRCFSCANKKDYTFKRQQCLLFISKMCPSLLNIPSQLKKLFICKFVNT